MDDLLIIGGGMAGLACAAHAKGRVRLLEKNAGAGRKLLLSGSGRCNITNAVPIREFFSRYGDHSRFVKPALSAVSNTDLIRFFEDRGLALRTRDGHVFPDGNVFPDNNVFSDNKIFPETDRARDVLRVLLHACDTAGVTVEYGITVREITRIDGGFRVSSVIGREFSGPQINVDPSVAPHLRGSAASPGFATSHFYSQTNDATNVVLATGGRSYPKTGASGEGYDLAASLGHTIVPPRPALAPVYVRHYRLAGCAGHAIRGAEVALYRAGKKIRSRTGDVLLTHHGLSGPAVLDLSRFVEPGDILRFSLLPEYRSTRELEERLQNLCDSDGRRTIKTHLSHLGLSHPGLPERLAVLLLEQSDVPHDLQGAHLDKNGRKTLAKAIVEADFPIRRPGGWNEAMTTAGGVALEEVNPKTLESKRVPGLFFCGEVLDIDGDCGGFNLQFAFSSGVIASGVLASGVLASGVGVSGVPVANHSGYPEARPEVCVRQASGAGELADITGLVFSHLEPGDREGRREAIQTLYKENRLALDDVFGVWENGTEHRATCQTPTSGSHTRTLLGGLLSQARADGTVLLWPAVAVGEAAVGEAAVPEAGSPERVLQALYRAFGQHLDRMSAAASRPIRAILMVDESQDIDAALLESHGFERLSTLVFMLCTEPHFVDQPDPPRLDFRPLHGYADGCADGIVDGVVDDAEMKRMTELTERTYCNTLDFPRLASISPAEEILNGYKEGGVFRPELWFTLFDRSDADGAPLGVLLMTSIPEREEMELTYMGLVESARGRGLAREIVAFAQAVAREEGAAILLTSVDAQNLPAEKTYSTCGFRAYDHKTLYLR